MGLIRKTLAIGTLGTVKGSSKKQRVARQIAQQAALTNRLLAEGEENAARRSAFNYRAAQRNAGLAEVTVVPPFSHMADQLIKLAELRDGGLLSEDEFAHAKQRLLAEDA